MSTANDYQNAVRDLGFARDKLRFIASSVKQICDTLHQWETTEPRAINGMLQNKFKYWPTGDSVIGAIDDWKKAAAHVQKIWDSLQQNTLGLRSPQELKW